MIALNCSFAVISCAFSGCRNALFGSPSLCGYSTFRFKLLTNLWPFHFSLASSCFMCYRFHRQWAGSYLSFSALDSPAGPAPVWLPLKSNFYLAYVENDGRTFKIRIDNVSPPFVIFPPYQFPYSIRRVGDRKYTPAH